MNLWQLLGTLMAIVAIGAIESNGGNALGADIPRYDVQKFCRAAVDQGLVASRASCLRNEANALATLRRRWSRIAQEKQAACIRDVPIAMIGASYDNLLSCVNRK
jgi:hypothetical protein